ncbi:MAG: serine/threonine protein kinase [Bradymonadales bacterium]|nr:MAG: serine/threonine protein kinase [Bradymonadales bacterium]
MDKTPSFIIQPFGNYILLDRLAVGGMAEIYKAKQSGVRGFEKIVVIKKILQHLREDPEFVEMFEDEAKIAAQLNQANIVQIYELGEVDEVLYITMEFVEGKNLRDITRSLKTKGLHLSIEQCLYLITEVLKGLDFAHRKTDSLGEPLKIIHRDMSPQNIVISYEGEVKILDFGIAKAASRISRTEAGVLKGKFSYMSPEQASGRSIDQTTDIYAVGVILHELLTSDRLFRAESDIQTLERVKAGFVPKPSEKNPLVSPALDEIVLKTLAREPENRYQSASHLLSDLSQFAIEQKLSLSSQELAAFMHSLFETEMKIERERLKAALEQAKDPLLRSQANPNTHIAFKSKLLEAGLQPAAELGEEITVSTYPEKKRKKRNLLIAGGAFVILSSLFALFFEGPQSPREPSSPSPELRPDRSEEASAVESPVAEPDKEEASEDTRTSGDSTEAVTRILQRPEPRLRRPIPVEEPPEVVEDRRTQVQAQRGRVNLIAPPEGYAQVFIGGRLIGSVPGPRARGIELEVGEHEFRCDTPQKSYKGRVKVEANQTRSIRCENLREDQSI